MNNLNKNYLLGVIWFIASLLISITNDGLQKYLGSNLPGVQITFLRFFFGTLSLLPIMLFYGTAAFYTSRPVMHIFRGFLLFVAIALWCYGLVSGPITLATTLTFTIPMFVLVMAKIFLSEKVGFGRALATLIGFGATFLVLNPTSVEFTPEVLFLLLAALLFATLDIINKKFVVKESMLAMLFYTALVTMLFGIFPAYKVWVSPTAQQYLLLALLGCGANLILYCLLKAFSYAEASAVAPFRYVELILSALIGFLFFKEIPTFTLTLGAIIIVPCTLFLVYSETRQASKRQKARMMEDERLSRGIAE